MSNAHIQDGKTLTFTNSTGADIAAGAPVVVGRQIGVAAVNIPNGESGELYMTGVHKLPKTAGAAIVQGTAPIFDVSTGAFVPQGTATATGDVSGAVTAWAPAASAATVAWIKLNTGIGTVA
jgi:predicted RecA/RadA family phage recombinase